MTRAARFVTHPVTQRRHDERDHQVALFDWIRLVGVRQYPDLAFAFHPANGELRMRHVAARLQRMGVVPGVPDVVFPRPRVCPTCGELRPTLLPPAPHPHTGALGLAIEMKGRGAYQTPDQRAWAAWLEEQGWCVRVCRSFEAARDTLLWYVSGEEEAP